MENIKPQMSPQNPLKQYFRGIKMYMRLPSGTHYYDKNAIDFNEAGEVGIMAMTGNDELILKNPDALLNGEALVEVIKSCAPSIKNPKVLLTNDIDALITAIRHVTYQDNLESKVKCPACEFENKFKLNLQHAIDTMTFLEDEYVIHLENELSVYVKPLAFPEIIKSLHAQFENSKLVKSIQNEKISEEEKLKIFGKVFKDAAKLNVELVSTSIIKIINESQNIEVTDKKHIFDFLQNVDISTVEKINELIKEINLIGIQKTHEATCEKCNHKWNSDIDLNPVNFSLGL